MRKPKQNIEKTKTPNKHQKTSEKHKKNNDFRTWAARATLQLRGCKKNVFLVCLVFLEGFLVFVCFVFVNVVIEKRNPLWNLGYVGNFLEGLCEPTARKFEAITGL